VIKQVWLLSIAGLLLFASVGFAQYTMELTGIGTGVTADGVYVSPYQGTITEGNQNIYSGYMICDDFADEAYLDSPWSATATNAGAVTAASNVVFTGGYTDPNSGIDWSAGTKFSDTQAYNAVAWLANLLVSPSTLGNPTTQTNISFAIWDIMDNGLFADPDGGAAYWIGQAFTQVTENHYIGSNVTVYTPNPNNGPGLNASQEFLVVTTPEASTPLLLVVDLVGFLALVAFLRKRAVRSA
jgi:hypothetical protein